MQFLRSNVFRKIFALVVGVVFLNLCFILSEINALKQYRINKKIVENIERIISINGLEEEKDSSSSISWEDEFIDLDHTRQNPNLSDFYICVTTQFLSDRSEQILPGVVDITIQPPEQEDSFIWYLSSFNAQLIFCFTLEIYSKWMLGS